MEQLPKLLPVDILLVSYNRLNILQKSIQCINERTKYPFRLIVIDNDSTDGSKEYLKHAKVLGKIFDCILLSENKGQSEALNEGFKFIQESDKKNPSHELFCGTNDDLLPPKLSGPCWLETMIHLFEKYEKTNNLGALAMRIERSSRIDVDESKELIMLYKGVPNIFRLLKKSDFSQLGEKPFGKKTHWESNSCSSTLRDRLKKNYALTTHVYASHALGFMVNNKGFKEDFTEYLTYSPERVNQGEQDPYPEITPDSQIPVSINCNKDAVEQAERQAYWNYWGHDNRSGRKLHRVIEQDYLGEYCKEGIGCDLGCGKIKCNDNCIGVDVYPHDSVDIVGDCTDLWMFKDNTLDFVVNSHLLEHLPDSPSALKEWKRVLKVGGILGIAVPDGKLKSKYILRNGHKVNLGLEDLKMLMIMIRGMEIIRLEHVPKPPGKYVALLIAKKIK